MNVTGLLKLWSAFLQDLFSSSQIQKAAENTPIMEILQVQYSSKNMRRSMYAALDLILQDGNAITFGHLCVSFGFLQSNKVKFITTVVFLRVFQQKLC